MVDKKISGKIAKAEGHAFEHTIAHMLNEKSQGSFLVEGASNTKVDVRDTNYKIRLSVKNPSNKNTQIGLYTQNSFIEAMNIVDNELKLFIQQFFGGDICSNYVRHRMKKSEIDDKLNQKFLKFLNNNTSKILDLIVTHGHNQKSDVNYMVWATKKNCSDNILILDLNEFKEDLMNGEWTQNETTFDFRVDDKKIFHLQMKGSGTKYTSGYHSLMFHIHNNFNEKYVKNIKKVLDIL